MSKYDRYFLMKVHDIAQYVTEKIDFFPKEAIFECTEIGDGNLNYVFRLVNISTGKSIIIKQAGESLRIDENMKLSTDRGRIEAKILGIQGKLAPGLVPEVYLYDEIMCAMLMEDMTDHTLMRTGLIDHQTYPFFSDHITTFLVNSLVLTSDIVMDHKAKKKLVKDFINPDLCEISEDLVFTEPFNDRKKRNNIFPLNKEFVEKELYEDTSLKLAVAHLKFQFLSSAQALIHGDLHTGSIFINQDHTFIFDPEFAFYGPMGYDIGNVIANLFFAWCHGDAMIEDSTEKLIFCDWILDTIEETIDLFIQKFRYVFISNVSDPMAKTEGYLDCYLRSILADTAGFAGLESIRRVVGMANVKDITSITAPVKRERAERIIITLAKEYILKAATFTDGKSYRNAIENTIKKY